MLGWLVMLVLTMKGQIVIWSLRNQIDRGEWWVAS